MKAVKLVSVLLFLAALFFVAAAFAQTDPGVRNDGIAGAGGPLASVSAGQCAGAPPALTPVSCDILNFFNEGKNRFLEVDSVSGTIESGVGLGPRFNSRSCSFCHAQPATGGSAPATNPQVTDASADGARNTIPSFITANGPVREARFPFFFDSNGNPNTNNPNGGVEDLFTITGRSDAGSCSLQQPSFALAQQTNNIIFRIPTPTFGGGLIENVDDSTLLTNTQSNNNNNVGIAGTLNHNGNDGTVTRFGWKAQNKSLEIFAGEAYNVEQGVSNELFTQERPLPGEDGNGGSGGTGLPANCRINGTPEDHTNFSNSNGGSTTGVFSDTVGFALFMRFLAAPTPSTTVPGGSASISNGSQLFNAVGCSICHNRTLRTDRSDFTPSLGSASGGVTFSPLSDIEIHHMGTVLADNVSQGGAGGDQFRSAPLWGLGKRIFFLHDGRCQNLLCAIEAHESNGGEATTVESIFDNNLTASQKQDVLNFLRSL